MESIRDIPIEVLMRATIGDLELVRRDQAVYISQLEERVRELERFIDGNGNGDQPVEEGAGHATG